MTRSETMPQVQQLMRGININERLSHRYIFEYLYYNSGYSSVCVVVFVSELLQDAWTDLLHSLG